MSTFPEAVAAWRGSTDPDTGTQLRQDDGRHGGSGEIGTDLVRVVGGVLVILVEKNRPGRLLRSGIERRRPDQLRHRGAGSRQIQAPMDAVDHQR